MSQPPPIEYQSPIQRPRTRIFSVATFLSMLAVSLALLILSAISAFHFEAIFKDFGVKLPNLTQAVLQFSRIFLGGGWIAVAVVTLITPFLVPLGFPSREVTPARMTRWIILMVATLLILLAIGFVFFLSMWLPMHSLITNISAR